jgi:hypothetical protein
MQLPRRAEAESAAQLQNTFVEARGLLARLQSRDHQVVFGRRGAGKTHALRYLDELVRNTGDVGIFLDMRNKGSTDSSASAPERAKTILVATLESVVGDMQKAVGPMGVPGRTQRLINERASDVRRRLSAVEIAGDVLVESVESVESDTVTQTGIGGGVRLPRLRFHLWGGRRRDTTSSAGTHLRRSGRSELTINYGELSQALSAFIGLFARRVWISIDEWAAVPRDLQPFVADLLNHCVLPVPNTTVKIAAIRQRSRFQRHRDDGSYMGLELGSDIAADIVLDEYLSVREYGDQASALLVEIIRRHAQETPGLSPQPRWTSGAAFAADAFATPDALDLLTRAAEGNARDAINIVIDAAQRADQERISADHITAAARHWYIRDKRQQLDRSRELRHFHDWLVDHVVRRTRARTFLLQQPDNASGLIDELYDARLLHPVASGLTLRDEPEGLFDEWALDFGAHATQAAELAVDTVDAAPDQRVIVSSDDYRAETGTAAIRVDGVPRNAILLARSAPDEAHRQQLMQAAIARIRRPGEYLVFTDARDQEWIAEVTGTLVAGRGVKADIRISDNRTSRMHASFTLVRGQVLVQDLGSTNGVFVNGKEVKEAYLTDRDEILIGFNSIYFVSVR